MGENQFFISYSRRQLYFVEALSLALQKSGLDVWMDLQQIEPGSDWQNQIDEGLRNCAGLILVASKQSLASPFVESEWRAVMDAGKPVYIAYYEEVDLPSALEPASLVDFRGSFKKGTGVLAVALKNMAAVREKVPPPNRLGLPQKMPPMIMLVAGSMVIGALFLPLQLLFTRSSILSPLALFTIGFLGTGAYLGMAWQFLHHKLVIFVSRLALWLLVSLFLVLPGSERLGTVPGIGWLMSACLPFVFLGMAIYLLPKSRLGAELLRWSAPGGDEGVDVLRRRFNTRQPAKDEQVRVVRHQVLAARNSESKDSTAMDPPRGTPTIPLVGQGTRTYSLHFAAADNPVANSLRHALGREAMQEVNSNAQTHIVILSQDLPRSKLQEFLDSGQLFVPLLISDLAFEGDALLEQAASLQLIDYRDRSKPTLAALARTLKESADGNLPVGFETNPKPLNSPVMLPLVRGMGLVVFSTGTWLVVSGLVSLTQSLFDVEPHSISSLALNMAGFVCGLFWIKLGVAFWQRKTTNFRFVPSFLISAWLAVLVLFEPFLWIVEWIVEEPLVNDIFDLAITLSSLFNYPAYWLLCLIFPGGFFVLWTAIPWRRRMGDWLPALVSRPEQWDQIKPRNAIQAGLLVLVVLALGGFITFGIRAALYAFFSLAK